VISLLLFTIFLIKIQLKLTGLVFFLPIYLVITIETARSDEWKALGHVFCRRRFQGLLDELAKMSPTIYIGGGHQALEYATCEDKTDWDAITRIITKKGRSVVLFKIRLDVRYDDSLKDAMGISRCLPSGTCCFYCRCCRTPEPFMEGLVNEAIVICNRTRKPFWMNKVAYSIFNLMLLGWPYRGMFNAAVKKKDLKIVKKVELLEKTSDDCSSSTVF